MVLYINILFLVSISLNLKLANAITNGHPISVPKRYMVYLLQDKSAPRPYPSWLCGGAIINHLYILTSAACVMDGNKLYVISGYNKYISRENMEKDVCIMQKRRRIVQVCTPSSFYPFYMYLYKDYWNYGDIGLAKVDVPFDFNDFTYYNVCSYPPAPIRVNLQHKFVEGGREVITLGWGSREFYRPNGATIDLNEDYLRYSAGKITAIPECIEKWGFYGKRYHLYNNVRYFFICVDKPGNLDQNGQVQYRKEDLYYECNQKVYGRMGPNANISELECMNRVALREGITDITATTGGFCQNDHGGPLVTWIGGIETLIGIASMFFTTKEMRCHAPFMYTSTVCINNIIACILEIPIGNSRRAMNCDKILKDEANIKNSMWPDEFDKSLEDEDGVK